MIIATYNINGITSRLPLLLRWLQSCRPDVVCLQELKCRDEQFPSEAFTALGYEAIWHGQSRWNGVAILSRVGSLVETRRVLPSDPDLNQSRYLEAAVNGLVVACLYAPNGNPKPGPKFEYKIAWMKEFRRHASTLLELDAPVVLIGDYNIIPTPSDVYKPERWLDDALFAPEARTLFARMLDDGWTDALFERCDGKPPFTFWHYWRNSFERDAGIRIDHALLNSRAAKRLKEAWVDREPRSWDKTSDHAPVLVRLTNPTK